MNKDEFNVLYPLDPRGTSEAQMNEYVERGAFTRTWNPDSECWMYQARKGPALDALIAELEDRLNDR
jgi:hypothetical protein